MVPTSQKLRQLPMTLNWTSHTFPMSISNLLLTCSLHSILLSQLGGFSSQSRDVWQHGRERGNILCMSLLGASKLRAAWGGRIYNFPMQLVIRRGWVWVWRQEAKRLEEGVSPRGSKHWEIKCFWSYISLKIGIFDSLPWKIYFSMNSQL